MSRKDGVSNRNTKIILTYVRSILGTLENLLDNMDYPKDRYENPEDYFINEDEWDTLETYRTIYHRAKDLVGDPNFFFNCGASSARYDSWGSYRYFKRALGGPKKAYELVPTFNKNFNDVKDITLLIKPHKKEGKIKVTFKLKHHNDIDPHFDYCSDPHIRGILGSVPEAWGLEPAVVTQPLVQYHPVTLLNSEFASFNLNARMEDDCLLIDLPSKEDWKIGERVSLVPTYVEGVGEIFLGRYNKQKDGEQIVLTEDLIVEGDKIAGKGTVFNAPYFVINVECYDFTFSKRIPYIFKIGETKKELADGLFHNLNVARKAVRARNRALEELKNYATDLEEKIEERTVELKKSNEALTKAYDDLKKAQTQLVDSEKRSLEHRITGGFAHEMRNALAGAQLEFKNTMDYDNSGQSSSEILKKSATTLLKNISDVHEKYNIPRDEIAKYFIPELKIIANIAEDLSMTIPSVLKDIERGLSITHQISDYARMSELKPGHASINMFDLLKEYERRYRQDFQNGNIKYSVSGIDDVIVIAEEVHLYSIFNNLVRNAIDALMENDSPNKEILAMVEKIDDRDTSFIRVSVKDNGLGIPKELLNEIFEPFFSTKPKSGTGLGLSIVKRLVQLYNGQINVDSTENKGTIFTVTFPVELNKE